MYKFKYLFVNEYNFYKKRLKGVKAITKKTYYVDTILK